MILDTNFDSFSITDKEGSDYIFEDNLLNLAKDFKFSEFTYYTLFEICKNSSFKDDLYQYCGIRLNLDFDQIKYYFTANTPIDSDSINRMLDTQYQRIQMVCIEFLYMNLPFNYLIKLNKLGKLGKIYNSDIYSVQDLRKDIISLLNEEIVKISNIDETMLKIKSLIANKKQAEKVDAIQSASQSVAKKTILENKFLISVIDTIPSDKLESLIIDILDDSLIQSNLV